jgi:hypothetical protein
MKSLSKVSVTRFTLTARGCSTVEFHAARGWSARSFRVP